MTQPLVKHRCTQYTPYNTPVPSSASHRALSTDAMIVEILSFLTEPDGERPSDVMKVCRSWLKNSANALRNTLAAQHTLSTNTLLRYVNLSVKVAALYDRTVQARPPSASAEQPHDHVRISKIYCPHLRSLQLTDDGRGLDRIYATFPETTFRSFLQQAPFLQNLEFEHPSSRLKQDISSSCPNLTSLFFCADFLLPHQEDLLNITAASPSINHLGLHMQEETGFEGLDTVITSIPSLTSLTLIGYFVPESAMQAIGNSKIITLRLDPCFFSEPLCRQFGPYLGNITHLTLGAGITDYNTDQLDLDDTSFSLLLEHNSCLVSLDLREATDLTDKGLRAIGTHCPQLTDLNVSAYSVQEIDCRDHFTITGYRAVVKGCLKLRSLNLTDRYRIKDRQIRYLQRQHPSLHINHGRETV